MRGSFHGPGDKLVVELLDFDLFIVLYNTKRKRKVRKIWRIKNLSMVG